MLLNDKSSIILNMKLYTNPRTCSFFVFKGISLIILVQSCGWTIFCRNALQCSTKHALRRAATDAAATTLYQANPAQTAWLQLEGRKLRAQPWLLMIRVNRLPKLRSLGKVYRQAGRQTRKCWVAYQAIVSLTARRLSAFCHMQVFENKRKDTAMFFAEFLSLRLRTVTKE